MRNRKRRHSIFWPEMSTPEIRVHHHCQRDPHWAGAVQIQGTGNELDVYFLQFTRRQIQDKNIEIKPVNHFKFICMDAPSRAVLWIRNYFSRIQIRIGLFGKFRIRIRFRIRPNLSVRRQYQNFKLKLQH